MATTDSFPGTPPIPDVDRRTWVRSAASPRQAARSGWPQRVGAVFFSLLAGRRVDVHVATTSQTTFYYVAGVFIATAALVFLMTPVSRARTESATAAHITHTDSNFQGEPS